MAARLGALRHPLAAARAGRWKKNLTVVEAHTPFSLHGPTHPSFNFMKHPSWYNEQVLQAYHPAMEGHWTKGRTAFWLYAIVLAGVGVVVGTAEYQHRKMGFKK